MSLRPGLVEYKRSYLGPAHFPVGPRDVFGGYEFTRRFCLLAGTHINSRPRSPISWRLKNQLRRAFRTAVYFNGIIPPSPRPNRLRISEAFYLATNSGCQSDTCGPPIPQKLNRREAGSLRKRRSRSSSRKICNLTLSNRLGPHCIPLASLDSPSCLRHNPSKPSAQPTRCDLALSSPNPSCVPTRQGQADGAPEQLQKQKRVSSACVNTKKRRFAQYRSTIMSSSTPGPPSPAVRCSLDRSHFPPLATD